MAFLEVQFPTKLALMAQGGPSYSTNINPAFSGFEQRNQNWAASRGSWAVSFEHKTATEYNELLAMFHAARGMANGFRLKDHSDFRVTGGFIAVGDGVTKKFQLQKIYTFPISQFELIRPIQKPVTSKVKDFAGNALADSVNVYVDGTLQTHHAGYTVDGTKDYSLDETTGVITFVTAPNGSPAPIITADFDFHYPVRFDLDNMQRQIETPEAAGLVLTVTGITLKEIRIVLGQSAG
jgi:uncharacterized protein (TIGR02217 family)